MTWLDCGTHGLEAESYDVNGTPMCRLCSDDSIRRDISGFEYDWLGCDASDRVALFSTAGGGYAPTAFVRDLEGHDAAIRGVLALPATTTARFAPELRPDQTNTWKLVAERGLYAYDSRPNGGDYQRVAAPTTACRLDDLPADVARVARAVRIAGDFEARASIDRVP